MVVEVVPTARGPLGTNPARSAKIILPEADIRLGGGRFEGANGPYRADGLQIQRGALIERAPP